MSEIESLESLSNAELRQKCLKHGLPNVPVTDSSRKVLIKKLALILGESSGTAKTNRRETIHSTRPMTPTKNAVNNTIASAATNEDRNTPSRSSRRTIAVPVNVVEEKEVSKVEEKSNLPPPISSRRRSVNQKTLTEVEESQAVAKPPPAITERRRSVRGDSQTKVIAPTKSNVEKAPETIAEEEEVTMSQKSVATEKRQSAVRETAPIRKKRVSTSSLEVGALVVLDSDEDEDDDLRAAAEQAEKNIKSQIPTAKKGNSRPPSVTRTSVYTSYIPSSATTGQFAMSNPAAASLKSKTIEEEEENEPTHQPSYVGGGATSFGYNASKINSAGSLAGTASSSLYTTASQKNSYSSFASSQPSRTSTEYTASRYSTREPALASSLTSSRYQPASASTYTSTLQSRPLSTLRTSNFINEQSDDNDIDLDAKDTPYLSNFARNLERLKQESLQSSNATLSSRYRSSVAYDRYGKPKEVNLFKQFWNDVNRKYHVTFYAKLTAILLLIIFLYILFFY